MGATLNITIEARSVQSDNWVDGGNATTGGGTTTVDGIAAFLFPNDEESTQFNIKTRNSEFFSVINIKIFTKINFYIAKVDFLYKKKHNFYINKFLYCKTQTYIYLIKIVKQINLLYLIY